VIYGHCPSLPGCRTALPRIHSNVRRCQSVQQVRRSGGASRARDEYYEVPAIDGIPPSRVAQRWCTCAHASGRDVRSCLAMIFYASWPSTSPARGPRVWLGAPCVWWGCVRRCPTLPHPGGCSTIGAGGLSFRVRNGSGRFPSAMAAVTCVELWPGGVGHRLAVLRELHSGCVVSVVCGKSSAY
jgi:hypothetical protein